MTSKSCRAAPSGANRRSSGTLLWNGRDSPVSTVPGCSATQMTPRAPKRLDTLSVVPSADQFV